MIIEDDVLLARFIWFLPGQQSGHQGCALCVMSLLSSQLHVCFEVEMSASSQSNTNDCNSFLVNHLEILVSVLRLNIYIYI